MNNTTAPTLIPLSRVQGLRITCSGCGASMVIPLDARHGPVQCFNCLRNLPGADLLNLTRELKWMRDGSEGVKVAFDVALEVDP